MAAIANRRARVIRIEDLTIDPDRYRVTLAGRQVHLTPKEYTLLRLLTSAPGRVFPRGEILLQVWGKPQTRSRIVDMHIRRLRRKLEDAHHTFIETVWNVGYRFKEPSAAA